MDTVIIRDGVVMGQYPRKDLVIELTGKGELTVRHKGEPKMLHGSDAIADMERTTEGLLRIVIVAKKVRVKPCP